jgi:hypothetical protein
MEIPAQHKMDFCPHCGPGSHFRRSEPGRNPTHPAGGRSRARDSKKFVVGSDPFRDSFRTYDVPETDDIFENTEGEKNDRE